jgi:tetratricopeptide (TPR) repeat protein
MMNEIDVVCCADCGEEGGASLKACTACKLVKYCNADCQRNHWPTHKKLCKERAAELRDEALFKDPPAKKDCPICFLPMPNQLIACISLPPATISSVPISDYAEANDMLAKVEAEAYFPCCGKSVCCGCIQSFYESRIIKCPYCKTQGTNKTNEKAVDELKKRVEANDASAILVLGNSYRSGLFGLQHDREKAIELWKQAAKLGSSQAHYHLGNVEFHEEGNSKRAQIHYEAAAMAGHEAARCFLANMELDKSRKMKRAESYLMKERAVKHLKIAASAGHFTAMSILLGAFKGGIVSRDELESILTAYNNSCAEMRSEARDKYISTVLAQIANRF